MLYLIPLILQLNRQAFLHVEELALSYYTKTKSKTMPYISIHTNSEYRLNCFHFLELAKKVFKKNPEFVVLYFWKTQLNFKKKKVMICK